MLVTAKKDEQIQTELPTRATYYSNMDETTEADPKVINYDEILDLNRKSAPSEEVSFETLNPDLLPSDTTMRVLRGEPFVQERADERIRVRRNTKRKAMVAVYAAAIVALLLVVILNAVALMRLSVSTANLEAEVAEAKAAVAELSGYAEDLEDPDRILKAAEELGYTFAE